MHALAVGDVADYQQLRPKSTFSRGFKPRKRIVCLCSNNTSNIKYSVKVSATMLSVRYQSNVTMFI